MDKLQIMDFLKKKIPDTQIFVDEPMKKHTSFKIGGNADIFVIVKNIKELKTVMKAAERQKEKLIIIGNGSNVLVKDKGIRGIVVKLAFEDITIENKNSEILVTVGAGVKLGILAQKLLQQDITGFEFASGIPGTIGGALTMNAGAHGKEMKDIVLKTKCLDLEEYKKVITNIDDIEIETEEEKNLEIVTLSNQEQNFTYRHSIFSDKRYIILQTTLKLEKGNKQDIQNVMDEYLKFRKEKQPIGMPNAGSTFKRGEDYITAKLIDECGLKGYTIGDAQVSEKHAGFIVNKGNATAEDVLKLVKHIQNVVYEKTGKEICLELEILGE